MLKAILTALGALLAQLIPALFREWRRKKEVTYVGKDAKSAVDQSVADSLRPDNRQAP